MLHIYIHLMEMSPHPERALRHGGRCSSLVSRRTPAIYNHMADSYRRAVRSTTSECGVIVITAAIVADRKFLDREGADNFYTLYRCHNYHFKIYGAMFLGQPTAALETADELIDSLPEATLRPMADWLEAFVPMKQHALIRFGMWQEILAQTLPEDEELYCVTLAMMRYARTVALSNIGDISAAQAERDLFDAALARVPESRTLFNNTAVDILAVAEQMMRGELEYHSGNHDKAFEHLRRSIELDDNLPYDEPWGWMQPTRHALGALLLDRGRYDEARPSIEQI